MSRVPLFAFPVLAAFLVVGGCAAKNHALSAWESEEPSSGIATLYLPFESVTLPLVCAWKLDSAGEGTIQYVLPTGMLAALCTAHAGKIQCASKSAMLSSLFSEAGVLVYERAAKGRGTGGQEPARMHAALSSRDIVIDFGGASFEEGDPGLAAGPTANRQAE